MTDVDLLALISNCKAASGDPTKVDWVDLENILMGIVNQNETSPDVSLSRTLISTATGTPGASGAKIYNACPSALKLSNGDILLIYAAYEDIGDFDAANLYSATYDGTAWTDNGALLSGGFISEEQLSNPSIYFMPSGNIGMLFMGYSTTGPVNKIYFTQSSDNGVTWSAATSVYTNAARFLAQKYHDVVKAADGTYYYPISENTNADPATQTGYYIGKLLYSANGSSWSTGSTDVTMGTNDVIEAGLFVRPTQAKTAPGSVTTETVVMYWRNRNTTLVFAETTNNGTSWNLPVYTGLRVLASTHHVGYYKNKLWAIHNRWWASANTQTEVRKELVLSVSNDFGLSWRQIANIDGRNEATTAYNQGVIFFNDPDIYIFYNSIEPTTSYGKLYVKKYGDALFNSAEVQFNNTVTLNSYASEAAAKADGVPLNGLWLDNTAGYAVKARTTP